MYDIIIIGGGPAGLTAAVYALRSGKKTLVIEKGTFGGQITFSPKVENIPGFTSVTGNEFAEKLVDQALFQGADFEACEVLSVIDGKTKTVKTDGGDFEAKAVIVATGAAHRLLGLENEEKFIGEGISFCAVCDGAFYKGKTVGVVGGGNSALQEAILLSGVAKKVIIIQNLPYLTGEKKLDDANYLFTTATCPNCKIAVATLDRAGFAYEKIMAAERPDLVETFGVKQAPTLVVVKDGDFEKISGVSDIKKYLNA